MLAGLNCRTALAATVALLSLAASAQQSHARIDLVPQYSGIQGSGQWLGIRFKLDPGWHIYWINSGDSGQPPSFQWTLPQGFAVDQVLWPTPERLASATLVDYGYKDEVTFLAHLKQPEARSSQQQTSLKLNTKFLVCREMCIPGKAETTLNFPVPGIKSPNPEIDAAQKKLPAPAPKTWKASGVLEGNSLVLKVHTGAASPRVATFFPLEALLIENAAPQQFKRMAQGFELRMKTSDQMQKPPPTLTGVLVSGDGKGYEVSAPLTVAAKPSKEKQK